MEATFFHLATPLFGIGILWISVKLKGKQFRSSEYLTILFVLALLIVVATLMVEVRNAMGIKFDLAFIGVKQIVRLTVGE